MNGIAVRERPLAGLAMLRDRVGSLSSAQLFCAIFVLAMAVRVALLAVVKLPSEVQFAEMDRIARSLAEHWRFADPYTPLPTGPTGHHAPMYPFLLSFLYRALGYGSAAVIATAIMNFAFASVQYALLPALAESAAMPRAIGIIAGVIGAVVPYRFLKETRWEATLAGATIVALMLLTLGWWRARERSLLATVLVGVAWGVGMMVSANLLLVYLVFALLFWIAAHRTGRPGSWRLVAAMSLGVLLAITPWTIRNYRQFHALVFMRTNFGLEFSLSNNPEANILSVDNDTIRFTNNYFQRHHPSLNREQAEEVRRLGEGPYNRALLRQALAWIRANPGRFMALTAGRFACFWVTPYYNQVWKNFLLTPWTILAACGLFLMVGEYRELGALMLAVWIGFPLVHYLVETDTRYRYPIDWSVTLLAVFALYCWQRRRARAAGASTPRL
jgi:hypothetical protein